MAGVRNFLLGSDTFVCVRLRTLRLPRPRSGRLRWKREVFHGATRCRTKLPAADFLPLNGTDHLEFFVGNARQAAYFYRAAFGMELTAYSGPETGNRARVSYVVTQNKIRFVLTTPLRRDDPAAELIALHGDGCATSRSGWTMPKQRGKRPPVAARAASGSRKRCATNSAKRASPPSPPTGTPSILLSSGAIIAASFCQALWRAPAYDRVARPTGLQHVDHIVGNVGWGEMNRWVDFYRDTMGFRLYQHFDDKDISTEYSALMSKVMSNGNGRVKFPINEPASGRRKSQIEEYLDFYRGPGVQHIAMATGDIIETVSRLRDQGIEFLRVPSTYYDDLEQRAGRIDEPVDRLRDLGILVDRDDEGYMLQIFTRPVEDRPTLFYEIIQRKGSRSFGKGNFKALFEAIEREQARRGNL